jgi:hypothetical protein
MLPGFGYHPTNNERLALHIVPDDAKFYGLGDAEQRLAALP